MKIQSGGDATRVLQSAGHSVFVEGSSDEEIDPVIIKELLRINGLTQIDVRPMGGCENVRSAAQALIRHHPSYYFLIDRDDQDQAAVERSWSDFPNPETHNVIIWRKRELENYFIDPDYLMGSRFLKVPEPVLRQRILDECNRRLFLDGANLTLLALHRSVRTSFASHFANPDDFRTRSDGEKRLEELAALFDKATAVAATLSKNAVAVLYATFVDELSGGAIPLQYGVGSWLERMSGKEVFRCIAGTCFQVIAADKSTLQGKVQNKEIAKGLLELPIAQQPADFRQLVDLLRTRVAANS
ncbi:hypothetical protein [uncultured Thiodictyon sp.]|jgi:hypothetical protein|uniref:hypothetical protein n=1 Tax=uncultured Thiodictyon sp. TaxID=1846217 RepID=UPI0025EBBAF5|nr:hypothetical protein [uncultured Thiodictyon sp.]